MTVAAPPTPANEKPFDQLTEPELMDLLANDWPWYARNIVKITNKQGKVVPLIPREGQLRLWRALKAQRDAGQPMRARVAKARQIGFSTMMQTLMLQRATSHANWSTFTVAHRRTATGNLAKMANTGYAYLPNNPLVKPPIQNQRRLHELSFGEPSRVARHQGRRGINSSMKFDTASDVDAGRSETIHDLHGSEVAFWRDAETKLTGLLQAVPDDPDTLVVLESTAQGYNYWKELWDSDDDFVNVFVAWHEEPSYRREFATPADRDEFEQALGKDKVAGEYMIQMSEAYPLELEQLHWWWWAFRNKVKGDLRKMWQEYPSNEDEMFLSTGRKVFDPIRVSRMVAEVEKAHGQGPPEEGVLEAASRTSRRTMNGTVDVPTQTVWTPAARANVAPGDPFWQVWEHPTPRSEEGPAGQYVIGVDVAGEEENEAGDSAWHAIEVVNHRTDVQAAEFRVRGFDADELAEEILLAALYWNRPWVAVEVTGGWGAPANRKLYRDFRYPFIYKRKSLEQGRDREPHEALLGWDSNKVTKRFLIEDTREDLRDGSHGVRSVGLAREHGTLVKDKRGMAAPERGAFSDRFMAFRIAKRVAQEKPVRPDRLPGAVTSTASRPVRSSKTGY